MDIGSSGRPRLNVPRAVAPSALPSVPDPDNASLSREKLNKYRQVCASRDSLILEAKEAGLTEVEIAELSGHSRNTVRSVLKQHKAS
ncbi:hypothetical protein ACFC34_37440 [Streptomyces sp. NPDC056053]|uniref:hypothetical protein n=1 Tax=Streptomyces sp. NPDC056053 TaxID=3345696 RepID=UPI0035E33349